MIPLLVAASILPVIWGLEAAMVSWHRWKGWTFFIFHMIAVTALYHLFLPFHWGFAVMPLLPVVASRALVIRPPDSFWAKPLWTRKRRADAGQSLVAAIEGWSLIYEQSDDGVIAWEIKPISDRWHILSFLSHYPLLIICLFYHSGYPIALISPTWISFNAIWILAGGGSKLIWMALRNPIWPTQREQLG